MTPRALTDRRHRRRQRWLFWGLAALLVGYGLFAGDHKPHHLALLWLEEQRTDENIQELAERNEELMLEHARLESDTLTLESLAREKGMIRPGDVVYRIVPVPAGVREVAAESLAVRAAREQAARTADSLRIEATGQAAPVRERTASPPVLQDPRWVPSPVPRAARDSSTAPPR